MVDDANGGYLDSFLSYFNFRPELASWTLHLYYFLKWYKP